MSRALILIVDPDQQHRVQVARCLISTGFEVRATDRVDEALGCLENLRPDLVIIDDKVKGLTPDALLEKIADYNWDTFVLVTAEMPDLDQGMNWIVSGAYAYLKKPVSLENLLKIIEKGLENKDAFFQIVTMAQDLRGANKALQEEKIALKEKTEELRFLNDLSSRLSSTLDSHQIVSTVARALSKMVGSSLTVFLTGYFLDEEIRLYPDRPLSRDLSDAIIRELCSTFTSERHGPNTACRVVEPYGKGPPLLRPPEYLIAVPLVVAGNQCGLIGLYFEHKPLLKPDKKMILENVALQSAQAMFNAHQHERALNMATHDALTGLLNRRALDAGLEREFDRFIRYGTDLSLIMIDLDRFKSVNDRFGHKTGDLVLKTVAGVIKNSVRGTDLAARFGGEEFAVLLPNTSKEMALQLALRIQEDLARETMDFGDITWRQTVSQGVADTRSEMVETPDDLLRLADHAMYLAKDEGRNAIRSSTDLVNVESRKDNLNASR